MSYLTQLGKGSEIHNDILSSTVEYQRAITQISQLALSKLPLVTLFQKTISLVVQVLDISGSDYWQVWSDGQKLCRVASTQKALEPSYISVKEVPLLPRLFSTCQPTIFPANTPYPEPGGLEKLFPSDTHGAIYVLWGRNTPLGVLTVYTHQPLHLSPDENQFLQVVTQLLVTATERRRSEALLVAQTQVLEQVASGSVLSQILGSLCLLLEQELPGAFCSVLLMNKDNKTLGSGVAPSLPQEYALALNGLVIGEQAGSCGTAAYRGEAVFVNDVATDPLWAPFRILPYPIISMPAGQFLFSLRQVMF